MLEHLVERPPSDAVVTTDRSLGDTFNQHLVPDLVPLLHVGSHPSPVLLGGPFRGSLGEPSRAGGDVRCCRFR